MKSRWIEVQAQDGGRFKAYLSQPPTGRGPGILLIQEIFGVNAHIRGVADQYAMDGYTVLAPDLFWRQQPGVELGYEQQDFGKGIALMNAMNVDLAVSDLRATLCVLRGLPQCSGRVASIGYCMGGKLSYLTAAATDIDAAVCYYGGGIHAALDLAPKIKAPLLFHFAEKDGFIPSSAVDAVRATFAGRDNVMFEVYAGVDHGFNCWDRATYDQTAA
jgi:carboxymethylenebutenolidase